MKQVASLRYGVIFKKAFCDVDVFKGFARDILGLNLEIDHVETEKSFEQTLGCVKVEFDLYAEDKKNRVIVDIQHKRHADHYDRFLHYHCVALLEQVKSSADYRPPLSVYTVVVLTSGDKHQCDVAITDFQPRRLNGELLNETRHKIIYICPKYLNDDTPLLYREWLRAIEDSLDEMVDESAYQLAEIQKVFAHIQKDDVSPEEKARMIEEYHQDELEKTAFDDGLEKGLDMGMEKGIEKGIEQGIEKGKIITAKAMLQEGLDMRTIAKITGLSEADILLLS